MNYKKDVDAWIAANCQLIHKPSIVTPNTTDTDLINRAPFPGTIFKPKCDCGAIKCNTTHATWCSTKK